MHKMSNGCVKASAWWLIVAAGRLGSICVCITEIEWLLALPLPLLQSDDFQRVEAGDEIRAAHAPNTANSHNNRTPHARPIDRGSLRPSHPSIQS